MATAISLLLFILLAAASYALEPITLGLTFSNDRKYVLGARMESTSLGMVLSTSTGDFVIAGTDCANCDGAPAFNISASTSALPLQSGGISNVTVLGSSVSGKLIADTCGLVRTNGSIWTYSNQTMIVANSSSFPFSSQVSGIFGLGTTGYSGHLNDTAFGRWLDLHPQASNFTYGMALKSPQKSGPAGVLHWTAYDPSASSGEISWMSSLPQNSSSSSLPASDWVVKLTQWDFSSGGTTISNTNAELAVLDPFHPEIRIPQQLSRQIFSGVPGANVQPGGETEGWRLDCSTKMSFTVHIGSLKFKVDETVLITKDTDGICYSTLVGWADPTIDGYLLGSSFISSSYLIFVISRSGPNSLGFANLPFSPSGLSNAAIGGISVAAAVSFIVAIGLVWLCIRRRREKQTVDEKGGNPLLPSLPSIFNRHSTAPLVPLSPASWHSTHTETEAPAPTSTSTLPSPQFPPPSTEGHAVTMSIDRTVENLAVSRESVPPSATISHAAELMSPMSPSSDIFAIDPYYISPPPYPSSSSVPSEIKEIKRRANRQNESIPPNTP